MLPLSKLKEGCRLELFGLLIISVVCLFFFFKQKKIFFLVIPFLALFTYFLVQIILIPLTFIETVKFILSLQ